MEIRDPSPNDAAQISELIAQLGYHADFAEIHARVSQVVTTPGHRLMVANCGVRVAGLIHFFERPSIEKGLMVVVQSLVVSEGARRSGIGRMLMDKAQLHARKREIEIITFSSRESREEAHRFCESLGFKKSGASFALTRTSHRPATPN